MDQVQKRMLLYGSVWMLGAGYITVLGHAQGWPISRWTEFALLWAVLVGSFAWRCHKRNKQPAGDEHPRIPARSYVSVGLPFLGVLASLIMSAIEWDFVAEGRGHLWQALAWTAGLAACIWLARQNRRAAVVMAFRVFLVLTVIGAIGHPSVAVFVALGVVAVAYFLTERLWPKQPPVTFTRRLD